MEAASEQVLKLEGVLHVLKLSKWKLVTDAQSLFPRSI